MWKVVTRKVAEQAMQLNPLGSITKIHSNLYEYHAQVGEAIVLANEDRAVSKLDFVANVTPALGGYLVLSPQGIPEYMAQAEYEATFS